MRLPPHLITLSNATLGHQAGIPKTRSLLNSSKEIRINHLKNPDFLYNERYNTVLWMNNAQNYCSPSTSRRKIAITAQPVVCSR